MTNMYRGYNNIMEARLEPFQPKKAEFQHMINKLDQKQVQTITEIVISKKSSSIELLLKYIHSKYHDAGLLYSLIHKLFYNSDAQIAYYVPELVYIAIKKPCKPMKRLLIEKSKTNQALKRLILWNVKAFTVLMKSKDSDIKRQIQSFEQELMSQSKNRTTFNMALKAIAMLTQASLTLKMLLPEDMKPKLLKFITKYNATYLSNLEHQIFIPFASDKYEKEFPNSNYIVHIVEQDCSCFPTRKRVPYRIIIETIDPSQLLIQQPDDKFKEVRQVPTGEGDLYPQVEKIVDRNFVQAPLKKIENIGNIYVQDLQKSKKQVEFQNYVKTIFFKEQQTAKESEKSMTKSKLKLNRMNHLSFSLSPQTRSELLKYKIKMNENVKKFDSIYIPGIPSENRRSQMTFVELNSIQNPTKEQNFRKSDMHIQKQVKKQVDTYTGGQYKDWNTNTESIFGQSWQLKKKKYQMKSYFQGFKSLRFRNVVVKGGDDLRQEIICMQLIYKMRDIIKDAKINLLIKPYEIIVLSENSGILEFVSNSISIDQMKKKTEGSSLKKFFTDIFETQQNIKRAKDLFVRSLAGSSILTYVLKLKDRHNGNILLDMQGNIIHIDFGFILGMAPGNINFESSPFKLTAQYIQLLQTIQSDYYKEFKKLFHEGMCALRSRVNQLTLILQIMMEESDLDCFKIFQISKFKHTFKLEYTQEKYFQYCQNLIERSCMNSRTVHYDTFQYYSNGIMF